MIIFKSAHFNVEQVETPAIPGYLIVRPSVEVRSLTDLSAPALAELGPLLAKGMAAIEKVVAPDRIYILRFGEEVEAIHVHLFPRTRSMTELYARLHPGQGALSGAFLFDWARRPEIVAQLRFAVTSAQAAPLLKAALAESGLQR